MRFLWIISFVALLFCAACSERGAAMNPLTLTDDYSAEQVVTLSLNQEMVLLLSSNRTTGYSWRATKVPPMLEQVGEAVYAQDAAQSGVPGAGGTEEWRFKATGRGTGVLEISCQRPWEKGPIEKRIYNITVR